MKPNTAVPPGVLDKTSTPPGAQRIVAGPGAGAGTIDCNTATATTATAVQTVTASAPHFVLPLQNNAATNKGDNSSSPLISYLIASSNIDSGALSATASAKSVIRIMKMRPVCTWTDSPKR